MMGYFDHLAPKTQTPPPEATRGPLTPVNGSNGTHAYAAAALASEAQRLREATEGRRNDELNRAWYRMGRHIAAGTIDTATVRHTLADAAAATGLPQHEIDTVLRDGPTSALHAAQAAPRHPDPTRTGTPPTTTLDTTTQTDTDEGPPLNPILDWHHLFNADPDEDEWIVEPILPARRMVALYSPPKAGKSLLMLEIAVAVARGGPILGGTVTTPRRVLYVDFENDPHGDIRTRLEAMEVGPHQLGNLCYLSYPSLAKFDTPQGAVDLMRHVHAYDCEVVVIDTISRAVAGEENENDTWLAFYRHTGLALKHAGVACIRLDHSGKDREKGMRGGSAKYGDVDAVWRLSAIGENGILLECTDHRMPVPVTTIMLAREDYPLAHRPVGESWQVVADARVREVDELLDQLGVPTDSGERPAGRALREAGHKVTNRVLREAIKVRRMRLDVAVETPPDLRRGAPSAKVGAGVTVRPGAAVPVRGPRRTPPAHAETARRTPLEDVACTRCHRPTPSDLVDDRGWCPRCRRETGDPA